MKRLKVNVALVAMVMAAFAAFAFQPAKANAGGKLLTSWFYNSASSSAADIKDAANYAMVNHDQDDPCITSGNRPCELQVNAADQAALQTYLDGQTAESVRDNSIGRKE